MSVWWYTFRFLHFCFLTFTNYKNYCSACVCSQSHVMFTERDDICRCSCCRVSFDLWLCTAFSEMSCEHVIKAAKKPQPRICHLPQINNYDDLDPCWYFAVFHRCLYLLHMKYFSNNNSEVHFIINLFVYSRHIRLWIYFKGNIDSNVSQLRDESVGNISERNFRRVMRKKPPQYPEE